jgi:hypothetical protein
MRSPALFARLAAGIILIPGEVAEWLNASVSKTDIAARLSRVRIPPSPLIEARQNHLNIQAFRRRLGVSGSLPEPHFGDKLGTTLASR